MYVVKRLNAAATVDGDGSTMDDDERHDALPWWPSVDARQAELARQRRARRDARAPKRGVEHRDRTTAEELIAVAVRIIDTEGLDALTVRRLAGELGVAAMTVYSYVRSKDELLDLVIDRIAADIGTPPPSGHWRERASALAHSLRDALLAHSEGARLISQRPMLSPNAFRIFDCGLGIFRDAGFGDEQAADAYFAFANYIMGCVAQGAARVHPELPPSQRPAGPALTASYLRQLPADRFPNVHALAPHLYRQDASGEAPPQRQDSDDSRRRFDFGLDSLLDGLAIRLGSQPSARSS
jgi:AcrR family transcriptional regulator